MPTSYFYGGNMGQDILLSIAERKHLKSFIKALRLPFKVPQVLNRTISAWGPTPLAKKNIAVLNASIPLLSKTLEKMGALVDSDSLLDGAVIDISNLTRVDQFSETFASIQKIQKKLKPNAKVLFLKKITQPEIDGALEGFVRSLSKELGGRGITSQLIFFPPPLESEGTENLKSSLAFFLTERSAFITGQTLTLSKTLKHDLPFQENALESKTVLVTGAAQGIGKCIADTFARNGATVIGLDHPSQEVTLLEGQKKRGGRSFSCDLSQADSPQKIKGFLTQHNIILDSIIHNAGVTRDRTFGKMTSSEWDLVLKVNWLAPISITEALLESELLSANGRIIFMSSVVGVSGNFGQTNYSASKAGLLGYLDRLSERLAETKQGVYAIAPGFIETAMTQKVPAFQRFLGRRLNSLNQGGTPEDIAEAALFLCLPQSLPLHGNLLRVCGQNFFGK